MNVREEDRKKNNCPSRGLGLAAAALGIGVGAALYYLFNKRSENPAAEGSTSGEWTCEQQPTFDDSTEESDFTTISENTTTDTSMHSTETETSEVAISSDTESTSYSGMDVSIYESSYTDSMSEDQDVSSVDWTDFENPTSRRESVDSETAVNWDVTDSPTMVQSVRSPQQSWLSILRIGTARPKRNKLVKQDGILKEMREKKFRQRSWSLEECSICFEVMLKDQELVSLPCTHNFHVACIGPWLQEHQTCPNCRKAAE